MEAEYESFTVGFFVRLIESALSEEERFQLLVNSLKTAVGVGCS